MTGTEQSRYVISVLVGDRVGVLRAITTAVTDLGANIDGISQTVVEGYFTVILTATFGEAVSPDEIRAAILANFRKGEATAVVGPYERRFPTRPTVAGDRYVVTINGHDRRGILKAVTTFLGDKGVNVEDWYVVFDAPNVTHVGEITVPDLLDIKQLQDEFRQLLAALDLTMCIQHENIFRATSEVGPIKPLLSRHEAPQGRD